MCCTENMVSDFAYTKKDCLIIMDSLEIFNKKFRKKKIINLIISIITVLMGFTAIAYVYTHWVGGLIKYRYLTLNGTVFTTFLTSIAVVVNIIEFKHCCCFACYRCHLLYRIRSVLCSCRAEPQALLAFFIHKITQLNKNEFFNTIIEYR